jgi:hypothetical protein
MWKEMIPCDATGPSCCTPGYAAGWLSVYRKVVLPAFSISWYILALQEQLTDNATCAIIGQLLPLTHSAPTPCGTPASAARAHAHNGR